MIIDLLGREHLKANKLLFFLYSDGTIEKKYTQVIKISELDK